ncbi:MAG TPA: tRNA threonylcarbamoyladenosine dehydratase [Accumulibacter sp.]|nr:tRNA threonylcarbamoyladenosine dehydratase [Accumulibacter sp.]HMW16888.1 tRNA threonylcarbamoyladenosine dehydratase [Accumulibacter sp.]HMX23927.1 tRNA threonylcarbamoyladenosine dehydratase [Accumulibacter sp.]HNC17335.1 tRNA threonylcarbamoyladenosine dehydratase [Accumulibacter sp.]HND79809.1 tRNA threonylcarbamoyladenosine dehydratase [Accumulibacter sp.]
MIDEPADLQRRFGGIGRLYGEAVWRRFEAAHVAVIGIGGVGSWAAEALARSAIGRLTLIDLDIVAESNVNRQIHAHDGEFGKAKVTAMAQRIRLINPKCSVEAIDDFVTPENVESLFAAGFDQVIDATDHVRSKVAMIACAKRRRLPLITVGGAGGQTDPTRILIADLALTIQDPLLSKVRSRLRKEHAFSREAKKKFGVPAIFSTEPLRYPQPVDRCDTPAGGAHGLQCAGFGSSVCVTATFGLLAAGEALRRLSVTVNP